MAQELNWIPDSVYRTQNGKLVNISAVVVGVIDGVSHMWTRDGKHIGSPATGDGPNPDLDITAMVSGPHHEAGRRKP